MNNSIRLLLSNYKIQSKKEGLQALREVLQEIVLVAIWRTKLFEKMAFYGGTALRILYGLNRFSEDLDFTLLKPDTNFKWQPFSTSIENELKSFGFDFSLQIKNKSFKSSIESAFLKTNTQLALLEVGVPSDLFKNFHPDTLLKIKIEVDTDPVLGFNTKQELLNSPLPIPVNTLVESDMFASKLHAALYRSWKNRVKGRDWYDVIWFISRKVPINLNYFISWAEKNFTIEDCENLDLKKLKELLIEKISQLDIAKVKQDIQPFIKDQNLLSVWSKEYFYLWIDKLEATK